MNAIIYLGFAINVAGALLMIVYALRYWRASKESGRQAMRQDELRSKYRVNRFLAISAMAAGWIVVMVGCYL